jgi:C4-dicarboxylate transporter DctM subunit
MDVASPFSLSLWAILLLSLLGLPIGHAMIAASIIYLLLAGQDMGIAAEQLLNGLYNSWVLLAVPLFLLSAELMNIGSMSDRLLRFCNALVGRFRGGLGHVNVVQSIIFAGMSGSAIADVAGTGKVIIDMMSRGGRYTRSYAAAITAATAVIGPIIPPSIPMVLYALVADTSIGYLFLGGVIPGLLMGLSQMAINSWMAHRLDFPVEKPIPLREIPAITLEALPALLMPVILLGGIYGGVMTPTEAAAVAAAYAFLVSALFYRSITLRQTYDALLSSARSTASIGMLIAGALVFNYVITVENIPESVRTILTGFELTKPVFWLLVNVILLILGCLLEGSTILLVIVPIFVPTAKALGIDLVHFGVVVVFNTMIGLITPPYGLLLFIVAKISDAPLRHVIRDTLPFTAAMIVALAIVTTFPETVLWLPRLLGYQG